MRPTEAAHQFARQVGQRAINIQDHALCNTMLSIGACLERISQALGHLYDEIHAVRVELDKSKGLRRA